LENAQLNVAYLAGADLREAHLEGAHMGGSHLKNANLTACYLERADLWEAHVEGANLTDAKGLTQSQLDQALGDSSTQLPEGLSAPTHWTEASGRSDGKDGETLLLSQIIDDEQFRDASDAVERRGTPEPIVRRPRPGAIAP
jgi:hypothetical protein